MKKSNIIVRQMKEEDIDFVITANKGVHESSNQTNEIIEFRERLKEDILSSNPKAYVVIAEEEDKPIGMALYSTVYFADEGQVMWLSNIFVKEEYRNEKVAKNIVEHLKKVCMDKQYYAICGLTEKSNNLSKYFFNSFNSNWLNEFTMFAIK